MDVCKACAHNEIIEKFIFHNYHVYSCNYCGFSWLNPQPSDLDLSKIYSQHYFLDEGDLELTEIVNKLKRATAELYLKQLEENSRVSNEKLSLLEIGCGMGDFLLSAQSKGFQVTGLEVTDHLVNLANSRIGSTNVYKGYIEDDLFEGKSFDLITFFDVIEHVRNPFDFLGHVNRLLKKSGKVYIVTPSLDSWSAKFLGKNWMEYKIEHLSYFTKKAMIHLLERIGFHKVKFYPNYKILNLDYINRHFIRFPVKGLSSVVNLIRKLTPNKLAYMPIKIVASGMAVIAEKKD